MCVCADSESELESGNSFEYSDANRLKCLKGVASRYHRLMMGICMKLLSNRFHSISIGLSLFKSAKTTGSRFLWFYDKFIHRHFFLFLFYGGSSIDLVFFFLSERASEWASGRVSKRDGWPLTIWLNLHFPGFFF